jgi:soluble lytic murein transglycosylase-like protein
MIPNSALGACAPRTSISRHVSTLKPRPFDVVRVLPLGLAVMSTNAATMNWRPGRDFRVICDCQRHARRERALWRRAIRRARQASRSTIALIVGVPIAFGALGIPMEAMNISIPTLRGFVMGPAPAAAAPAVIAARTLPIITPKVRQDFLSPDGAPHTIAIDLMKEDYFRSRVPYGTIIYREAKRNNLQPELVAAVVEAESDFRAKLVSGKNAQGLMQIIPSTGRLLGADDLFNPAENIAAGTKYLRYLVDRFRDERVAIAAYNAGEGNVEKFGGIPPFPETLNYIERVNVRTRQYRQRIRGHYAASLRLNSPAVR